jgi:hypothetical protein
MHQLSTFEGWDFINVWDKLWLKTVGQGDGEKAASPELTALLCLLL